MVADDALTDSAIAAEAHITKRTLERWKRQPEFQARVAFIVDTYRQAILTQGIADRVNRITALNDRWERMKRVIDERAAEPSMTGVPGGTTGLLVRTYKAMKAGKDVKVLTEYTVDTGLLAQLNAVEMQAAKELGQLIERSQIDVTDRGFEETLDRKLDQLSKRLRAESVS